MNDVEPAAGMRTYRARLLPVLPISIASLLVVAAVSFGCVMTHDWRAICAAAVLAVGFVYSELSGILTGLAVDAQRFGARSLLGWRWISRQDARSIGATRGWPPRLPHRLPPKWDEKWSSVSSLTVPMSCQLWLGMWNYITISSDVFAEYEEIVAALRVFFTSDDDPLAVGGDNAHDDARRRG